MIVSYAVSSGQRVGKGGLLFETLSGAYRGETGDLTLITAPADGVIASLSVSAGSAVAEGAQIASFYPAAGLRVEAFASESDLAGFRRGDPVQVEMIYAENVDKLLTGKVEYISVLGTAEAAGESDEAAYAVCVVLDAVPDSIAYGMSAIVTAAGRTAAADEPPAEEAAPEAGD